MGRPSQAFREIDVAHQALLTTCARQAVNITRLTNELVGLSDLAESASQEIKVLRREVETLRAERHGVVLRQVGEKVMVVRA